MDSSGHLLSCELSLNVSRVPRLVVIDLPGKATAGFDDTLFSERMLSEFDGSTPGRPIYLAVSLTSCPLLRETQVSTLD